MALDWFILAIIATLLWSLAAIITKFIRVNYIKSPIGYMMITLPSGLFILFLLFFGPVKIPSPRLLLYILIIASLAFVGFWFYLSAMHKEEISRVITLFGTQPLMVLILATIFLQETLTIKDYLAFPLIIIGSMLISVRKVEEKFKLSAGVILTLLSVFIYSIHGLLFKLASEVDFVSMGIIRMFIWTVIGVLVFIFSKKVRTKTKEDLKQINKRKVLLLYIAEFLGITGMMFSYVAIQRGPVSLVALIEGTQGLFVIVLAALVSIFIPKILKEEITKKTISLKVASALLMIAGLYLIAI